MDKKFLTRVYNGYNYLFMLGLKLNHVSKRGPWTQSAINPLLTSSLHVTVPLPASCPTSVMSGTSLDPCYGTLKYIQVLYSCIARKSGVVFGNKEYSPYSKAHGANMGTTWGRQDPGGPHVGHMNLVTLCMLPHPRQFHTMPSIQFNDWWNYKFLPRRKHFMFTQTHQQWCWKHYPIIGP